MPYTIAIAGISSALALKVAAEVLKQPNVHVRGSSRDIGKLPPFLKDSPRVTLVQCGPYDTEALRSLIRGCEVVVCCYYADSETMLEGQKLLVDLCEEEGVSRYIASDYTSDFTKLELGDVMVKDPMKHIKAYLDEKPKVNGVHILVGLFMETFWGYFDVWDSKEKKLRYWGTGHEEWDLMTYQTAAEYVAAVALDPEAIGIKKFGNRMSLLDIAKDVEAACGFTPSLENAGSVQDVYQAMTQGIGEQDTVSRVRYFILTGKIALGSDISNADYPQIKPESFRDFLRGQTLIGRYSIQNWSSVVDGKEGRLVQLRSALLAPLFEDPDQKFRPSNGPTSS